MKNLKRHLNPATVISCVALFVALGGAAYAAGTIGNKSVKTRHLGNGAVTTAKLRNLAVTAPKLGEASVTSGKLASGAVRSSALGGGVVTEGKVKNGAVSTEKLANGAVTNSKLGADGVTTGKLQDGAVTGAKLAPSFLAQLVKNVSYVLKESLSNPEDSKTATAECPAGKQLTGGGAKVLGANTKVVISESAPAAVNAEGKRIGWTASAREVEEEGGNWAVEAYAICAEF